MPRENLPGLQMLRMPMEVSKHLNERGRWNAQMSPGSEIRCVTDSDNLRLFISSLQGDGPLLVFQGDFLHSIHSITPGTIHCIHVNPVIQKKMVNPEALRGRRFAPDVWRFFMSSYMPIFHDLETYGHEVRPPNADEKPKVCMLAYGSSITAGSGASRPHLGYVQQAAWRLDVDVFNMGQGGACMCEPELADFFATRGDWDFAILEIGVNMLSSFTTAEFAERATYLINTVLERNPGKPVVLITPYPNLHHFMIEPNQTTQRIREYTAFLREFAETCNNANLYIIDGFDIMTDFCGHNVRPGSSFRHRHYPDGRKSGERIENHPRIEKASQVT